MIFKSLIIERSIDDVCMATVNRPMDRNSLNSFFIDELFNFIPYIEKSGVRAVIITGYGEEYFIGGADGTEMMHFDSIDAIRFSEKLQKLFNLIEDSPIIFLAAINGLCFGGGFEFAMSCDIRIASEQARIGLPETKFGIVPGGGGSQRLPGLIGTGKAMEMILSGKLYGGKKAEETGLVNSTVSHEELIPKAIESLKSILRNPKHAIIQAKRAIIASKRLPLEQGLTVESTTFGECFSHNYFKNVMEKQLNAGILKTSTR